MTVRILQGDCRDVLRTLPDESVHAVVTDPPYHLTSNGGGPAKGTDSPYSRARAGASVSGFMGKTWDGGDVAFQPGTWREVLRVLKPGGHLLAFGGSRTYHRLVCAVEDAGFEIRDQIMWLYGSGFPKSKNLDGNWEGWGTALKPAHEPIVVARKPLVGTAAANVLAHGCGALNIDGCRIPAATIEGASLAINTHLRDSVRRGEHRNVSSYSLGEYASAPNPLGRWPANVIHDGSEPVALAFAQYGERGAIAPVRGTEPSPTTASVFGARVRTRGAFHSDSGTAARFFYCAKASKADRGDGNDHPTVKPTELMRYLVRLVTPAGGVVLDPFAGSGSTGRAASIEGFDAILIEKDQAYAEIAHRRIAGDAPLFAQVSHSTNEDQNEVAAP